MAIASVERLREHFTPSSINGKKDVFSRFSPSDLKLDGRGIDINYIDPRRVLSSSYESECFKFISSVPQRDRSIFIGPNIIDRVFSAQLGELSRPDALRFVNRTNGRWKLVELFELKSGLFVPENKLKGFSQFLDRVREGEHLSRLLKSILVEKNFPEPSKVIVPETSKIVVTFVSTEARENTIYEDTPYRKVSYVQVAAA